MKKSLVFLFLCLGCMSFSFMQLQNLAKTNIINSHDSIYLKVLGIAQDGGYPQIGCTKTCCKAIQDGKERRKNVVSLGLSKGNKYWLFEATPDIGLQLNMMQEAMHQTSFQLPAGIFISHAHMGHYTGLQFLGREALGSNQIPVYAMPKMESFLKNNGPWSQLVQLNNISIKPIQHKQTILLDNELSVTPILVPHRDEFSETIGFMIQSHTKKVLFIPDIDKWEKWEEQIIEMIKLVDLALIDGTFFQNGELLNRDMREVPHPFVEESVKKFANLKIKDKSKICFIHFNHTNPLIQKKSTQKDQLIKLGYHVAEEGMHFTL